MNMLELKDISKRFPLTNAEEIRSKGISPEYFNDGKAYFWALRNISCAVESGKILGIVGRNGAGKTTLMYIIAGIVTPTEGTVQVSGRVSSLFSLGAGFQDELSGKENIFLNASLLGMPDEEIRTHYRSILEFSELNEFIHMPLGNYSQGMKLRLGFSVAIHLNFDILVIDEVLMVGDGAFQKKCFEKLADFRRAGKTMVITSQTLDVVERLSDEIMVIERGEIVARGDPKTSMDAYKRILSESRPLHVYSEEEVYRATKWWAEPDDPWGKREGTREVEILDVLICSRWGIEVDRIKYGEKLVVKVKFAVKERIATPHFGVALFRDDRVYCYGPNTVFDGITMEELTPGRGSFSFVYKAFNLMPGRYFFAIVIWDEKEAIPYDYFKCIYSITVEGKNDNRQLVYLPALCDKREVQRDAMEAAGNLFDLQTLNDQWGKGNPSDCFIKKVRFLDRSEEEKAEFFTGEAMKMEINYELPEAFPQKGLDLWLGIFRSDKIFCCAYRAKIMRQQTKSLFEFPALVLLPGKYYCSIGIWDTKGKALIAIEHGMFSFAMCCRRQDHGTVYLEHHWKIKLNK